MKKYIYAALALVLGAFASCTDQKDIEVIISHNVDFTIKTKKLYKTFSLENNLQEYYLRDKTHSIGVQTFIYDSEGKLAASEITYDFAYNNQSFGLTLKEGDYTVICVETLSDPENDNSPIFWEYKNINNLNNISITPKYSDAPIYSEIGVYTEKINVSKDIAIEMEPEAVGSLLNIYYFHFDKSDYVNVGFGSYTNLTEYKLNPDLDRDSRYVYENSESDYFILKGYLTVEESESYHNVLYFLDNEISYVYKYQDADAASESKWAHKNNGRGILKMEDGETYYGGYAYYNDNTHYNYLGDYEGFIKWSKDVKEPETETEAEVTFKTPDIEWGTSVAAVKSYMSGYSLASDIEQTSTGIYYMAFNGKDDELGYQYYFKTATESLIETDVIFEAASVDISALKEIVAEDYDFVVESDGSSMYISSDYKTVIIVYTVDNYNVIGYLDYEYITSSSEELSAGLNCNNINLQEILNLYSRPVVMKEITKQTDEAGDCVKFTDNLSRTAISIK